MLYMVTNKYYSLKENLSITEALYWSAFFIANGHENIEILVQE